MSAPSGRDRMRRGLLVRMLLALLLAVAALPCAPGTTSAATIPKLEVQITGASVDGSDPASTLVIGVTVTNRATTPVYGVRVVLWRSTAYLHSLGTVREALSAGEVSGGRTFSRTATQQALIGAANSAFAPGATASVTLSSTLGELGLDPDASYWVGANVTAGTSPGTANVTASGRTLATVPDDAGPVVVRVVDLSSTPRVVRPNLFADDSLATELDGRLRALVDAASAPGVSWVIDPALYAAVKDMADGYNVVSGDGTTRGTGQAAAVDWLARFAALDTSRGYRTLYGQPDVVGALESAAPQVLSRARAATEASGLDLPTVALTSRVSADALAAFAQTKTVVVSDAKGFTQPWNAANGANLAAAVPFDAGVTSPLLGDSPAGRSAALIALARATGTQVRLLRTEADLAVDAAASPSWFTAATLGQLATTSARATEVPGSQAPAGGVTPGVAARLDALAAAYARYGSAATSSRMAEAADAQASRGASEAWLTDAGGRDAYLAALEKMVDVSGRVLVSATSVTLSSQQSEFPATVTNRLSDAITVRVTGRSENSARIRVQPSGLVTISPGDSMTVLLTATATANGIVPVTLHVESEDGHRLSDDVYISVEATRLGIVGWIIVVVSGVVLAVTTALRIRQMRRRRGPS